MKAGDKCPCEVLCMTIRRTAESTQADHQCARKAHLPGRAQAAGCTERPRIRCAEDQALSEEGVQSHLLSRPSSSDAEKHDTTLISQTLYPPPKAPVAESKTKPECEAREAPAGSGV